MRLRYDKQAIDKLLNSKYLIKDNFPIILNETDIVEIGMGKGEMIAELARINPNKKFYGFEKYPTVAAKVLNLIDKYKLTNLFIIVGDAGNLLNYFQGNLETIWLTFSDPWPKARHEKRRLTYKLFLDQYKQIMNEDSLLKLKTDNDFFYNYSIDSFLNNGWKIIANGTDLHKSNYSSDNIMTGYEKKWISLNKNINFIFAKKMKN
ncbi:tRNA (guanosine(46)-N7)-methyltransferase TrmB [Mycoplasma sp. 1018B]|uniref:tRNA (guanosine(46)-N7)-methyltransferase TrmB n=1 Tax=Mycoplasma sp. 1018B TaxID=2967302 RepID=UPI00211BCD4D|nr:tRNA (guanosine(46)-N7)-methyltransferase TrmB [Mycoplasma sp. 1018B]UUM19308.1 tRNA (guanosine(46)-N7)-methyltransferase TrmB [Mycoplasma sp. 1018B]